MTLRLGQVTVNSTDPLPLARWWAEQLGGHVTAENDGWFVMVEVPGGPGLAVQKVSDPTPGRNRLHLDLVSADLDAAAEQLLAAGATHVRSESTPDGFRWQTFADPDGNEFCVSGPH